MALHSSDRGRLRQAQLAPVHRHERRHKQRATGGPVTPSTSSSAIRVGSPAPQAPAIARSAAAADAVFHGRNDRLRQPGPVPWRSSGARGRLPSAPAAAARLGRLHGILGAATHMTKAEWREACKRTCRNFRPCCAEPLLTRMRAASSLPPSALIILQRGRRRQHRRPMSAAPIQDHPPW